MIQLLIVKSSQDWWFVKRVSILTIAIFIYLALQGTISFLLYERYLNDASSYAHNLTYKNASIYQGLIDSFRPLPESIFLTLIDYQGFNELVNEANKTNVNQKEYIKKALFATLKPIFEENLKPKGFKQLQLHLQSSERFLQLFDPKSYIDEGVLFSHSQPLNKPLVYQEGFDGKSGDYHYFFPLIFEKERIGTIEMSISFEHFNKSVKNIVNFAMSKTLTTDFSTDELMKYFTLNKSSAQKFQRKLLRVNQNALVLNNSSILTAFSLQNANGENSGYLFNYIKDDDFVKTLFSRFIENTIVSAILLILIIVLTLFYYRHVLVSQSLREHGAAKARADALQKQNTFLSDLFQTIPSPAFLKNLDGEILKCNEAFANLMKKPSSKIVGSTISETLGKEYHEDSKDADNYVLSIQNPFTYEYAINIFGEERIFIIHKNLIKNNGEIFGIVAILQEITKRKKYQERLELALEENRVQKARLEHDHEIINNYTIFARLDSAGTILEASKALVDVSGFSTSELVGKAWHSFSNESEETISSLRIKMAEQPSHKEILSFDRKDGNRYWLKCTILSQTSKDDRKYYMVFGTDISNEIHIKKLSTTDDLTQIDNRRKLTTDLKNALRVSKRYPDEQIAFILFDIDDFKKVNDTHGHLVGDAILKELAHLVKSYLREVDSFARWGGEEFAIIAPKTDMHGALNLTEKLRDLISSYRFKDVEHITCSFGVTEIKSDDSVESITKRVDEALYISKDRGKNRVEFLA